MLMYFLFVFGAVGLNLAHGSPLSEGRPEAALGVAAQERLSVGEAAEVFAQSFVRKSDGSLTPRLLEASWDVIDSEVRSAILAYSAQSNSAVASRARRDTSKIPGPVLMMELAVLAARATPVISKISKKDSLDEADVHQLAALSAEAIPVLEQLAKQKSSLELANSALALAPMGPKLFSGSASDSN